jgi:hypothetical protein
MSLSNMKADPRGIIRAHRRTYIDARTGKRHLQDYLVLEELPIAVGIGCAIADVKLAVAASVGLLTVSGLLSAFLFGVMLQISERALDWSDSSPTPGPETSAHATYLAELAANSGYASLVSIVAAGVFVVSSFSSGWWLRISSAVGLALAVHLALVLFMVMKRVFALTQQRLNRARTGADRDRSSPPNRRAS